MHDIVEIYAAQITDKTTGLGFTPCGQPGRHPLSGQKNGEDGAQAVGMIPVDLRDLGVDFYATSLHQGLQAPQRRRVTLSE